MQNRPLAATLWMLMAMLMIGLIDNLIAGISSRLGLWQFFVLRTIIAVPAILCLPFLGLGGLGVQRIFWVLGRSGIVAGAMLCYFGALGIMPIAQALAGLYTAPIFVLIFGLLMGRRIGPWRMLAVGIGFSGALLVLQPGGGGLSLALLLPIFGGALYAVGALVTREKCSEESTVVLLLGTMGLQGVISALVLLTLWLGGWAGDSYINRGWVWPRDGLWGVIWVQALGSIVGVYGIVKAYQLADASLVSVIEYSVMIFGPLFGWWLFGQSVSPLQTVGIGLIVLAGLLIAWRGRVAEQALLA